ncbi:MAG: HAMP domain-containing sensor histidine kinase [Candidatus Latescibacterota bacterium]
MDSIPSAPVASPGSTPPATSPAGRRSWPLGRSLFAKQLLLYLLVILLLSGVISVLFFSAARQHLEAEIGRKLQYIARIAARSAPAERLELIRPGDDQSRMVLRLKEKLAQVQEATGVRNITVFRPDGTSLLDLRADVPIGAVYAWPHFSGDLLGELESRPSVSTGGYQERGEEIVISAYAPIPGADGRLFAVVGVDAGAEELRLIERMRARLYGIAGVSIVLAGLLALAFARRTTARFREMARTAEQLGAGHYQARARIGTQDEVGQLAQAINRMAEQVRNRDAALKEMAASVAHEVRNPLNSIRLLVSLLAAQGGEEADEARCATVATLHYEIGKLNRFIEEFLTYARPITLLRDQVSPASLVASVLDMGAAEAAHRQVELQAAVEEGMEPVTADRLRLEQALLNLVLNAIQACGPGGQVRVRAAMAPGPGGVCLAVEDTGPGLQEADLPRLFEPFFTTKEDGTGLGLANVRKIVEEHGGRVGAANRPQGGACFTLHLPARCLPKEIPDGPAADRR